MPVDPTIIGGEPGDDRIHLNSDASFTVTDLLGNNTITTGGGNDTITTGGGNDEIHAGEGANRINAGGGNNKVTTGGGNDTVTTGGGNDEINAGAGANRIDAGGGNNKINTGGGADTIEAGDGDDEINAGEGANDIIAGAGTNKVNTGGGNDTITTGGGNDEINAGEGANKIDAGGGTNKVNTGGGADTITTLDGDDEINAGDGINDIHAGGGTNKVNTGSAGDFITTGGGNDEINAGEGANSIHAGGGTNKVNTGAGADTITTLDGDDEINAGEGANSIHAGGGTNKINTGSANDTITTGGGNDEVHAGEGHNTINVGGGTNVVHTGSGSDAITTGAGGDTVFSGEGGDTLTLAGGADLAHLGGGDDLVVVTRAQSLTGAVDLWGGSGTDTLRLVLTADEARNAAVRAAVDGFKGHLSGNGDYQFKNLDPALDLRARQFERFDVYAPVDAHDDTATVSENGPGVTINVLANDEDLLAADKSALRVTKLTDPAKGSLTLNADGTFTYNPLDEFQSLQAGETATVTFTYRIDDNQGYSDTATVTITITGANDAPVITSTAQSGTVTELAASQPNLIVNGSFEQVGGTVPPDAEWTFRSDVDGWTSQTSSGFELVTGDHGRGEPEDGTFWLDLDEAPGTGNLSIASDAFTVEAGATYRIAFSLNDSSGLDNGVQVYLGDQLIGTIDASEVPDTGEFTEFAYTVGAASSGSTSLRFVGTGTPDGIGLGLDAVSVRRLGHMATGAVTFSDVDTSDVFHTASVSPTGGGVGYLGTLSLSNVNQAGNSVGWTFSVPDGALDFLAAGQQLTQTYTVTVSDGKGGTASQLVTITITGTNDAATISGTNAGSVTEDETLTATGSLAVADADSGENEFAPASGSASYGTFSITAGGAWTYTLTNTHAAVQALPEGETLTDSFTVYSEDGTDSEIVTITITGTNEAPEITSGAQTVSVTELADLITNGSFELPEGSYSPTEEWVFQSDVSGWTSQTPSGFELVTAAHSRGAPADGTFWLDLDEAPDSGNPADSSNLDIVSDPFAVEAGTTYRVSFSLNNSSGAHDNGVNVYVGDDLIATITGSQVHSAAFQEFSYVFTAASSDPATLRFEGLGIGDGLGFGLDAVSVRASTDPVGEPISHTATGVVTFTDADALDTHQATFAVPDGSSYLGTFELDAIDQDANSVDWTFTVDDDVLNSLGPNDVLQQTYTVSISDGVGVAYHTVTVEIRGMDF